MLDALDVVVRAGGTDEVRLHALAYAPPPLVEVAGALFVPPEWELVDFGLYLEPLGEPTLDGEVERYRGRREMEPVAGSPHTHAWSFGALQAGSYAARFNPLGSTFLFEVPPQGARDLLLVVPPPAVLEVRVVNEANGQLVADANLFWMPSRRGVETGGVLNGAGPRSPGSFRIRCPAGTVELWCSSDAYRFRREVVEVEPGTRELLVELGRAEGIALRVLAGGTPLVLRDAEVTLREVEGDGEGWRVGSDERLVAERYVVTRPGLYRIEAAGLPAGYAPPAPLELLVLEGTCVVVVLEAGR